MATQRAYNIARGYYLAQQANMDQNLTRRAKHEYRTDQYQMNSSRKTCVHSKANRHWSAPDRTKLTHRDLPLTLSTVSRPPWTLFPKCFSSFPHGTCSLSVSCPYLALDDAYHPLWAAFPNNSTLQKCLIVTTKLRLRDCHPVSCSFPRDLAQSSWP